MKMFLFVALGAVVVASARYAAGMLMLQFGGGRCVGLRLTRAIPA